jgi:predicted enzyme related to lactoylglutathione lyase
MRTPSQSAVSWFEIPAADLARAKAFYESILAISFQELNLANGLKMALFPVDSDGIGGALAQYKDFYFPGNQGPVVYLNANPDLQTVLDRVEGAGGSILMPKTQISEENGYMALFQDSEGNRIALHSVK